MHFSFYRHTKPLKGMHFGQFYRLKCSSMYGVIDVYPTLYHGEVLFLMFNLKEDILSYNYVHKFCISIGELFF